MPSNAQFCPTCGTRVAPPAITVETVRRTITALFCDLSGSTALGDARDPELMRTVVTRYFGAVSDAIEQHGGTVEKFIGDAVMAVFGVPELHEDDALRAVRAAVDAGTAVDTLNDELERDHGIASQCASAWRLERSSSATASAQRSPRVTRSTSPPA